MAEFGFRLADTKRGWVAHSDDRGVAAVGPSEEEAVRRLRAVLDLMDQLLAKWREARGAT